MLKRIERTGTKQLREYLDSRSAEISEEILLAASRIIEDVRRRGDAAAKEYTLKFDGIETDQFRVSEEEIDEAIQACDPFFMESMRKAKENIEFFHRAQIQNSYIQQKGTGQLNSGLASGPMSGSLS